MEIQKNITWVVKKGLCISCGTCASVCEKGLIDVICRWDRGYYTPVVRGQCNSCGRCLSVCPGIRNYALKDGDSDELIGNYIATYIAYSKDNEIRRHSSSGGMATTTLLFLLRNRMVDSAITAKMFRSKPLLPRGFFALNEEDIREASGSKYCPVPMNVTLRNLDLNRRYAYIGLPCHLHGLQRFLNVRPEYRKCIKIRLGLFCSRTPSFRATDFLLRQIKVRKKDVLSINYRCNGHPGRMEIVLKSGETKTIDHLDRNYWGYAFQNYFMQYRCWLCGDKAAAISDISMGDDWTISIDDDPIGRSNIIVRSAAGAELIESMKKVGAIEVKLLGAEKLKTSQGLKAKCNVGPRMGIAKAFRLPTPAYRGNSKGTLSLGKELLVLLRIKLSYLPFGLLRFVIFFGNKLRGNEE